MTRATSSDAANASPGDNCDNVGFTVTWWGVRGSTQVPGGSCVRFGGNTTCIEVRCDDHRFIIDAGTGLRELGAHLAPNTAFDATLLFTHYHLDHVVGLPFFAPLFQSRTTLRIAGDPQVGGGPRANLPRLMSAPFFPVEFTALPSQLTFLELGPDRPLELGPVSISTCLMNHPGGASGIRIQHRGRAFVHLSDVEHRGQEPDEELVTLSRGAEVLSYDAMFDEAIDYEPHRGWGHSTWQAGLTLARVAGVRRYVATHHAPEHDDAFLDEVCSRLASRCGVDGGSAGGDGPSAAQSGRRPSLLAWEGLELDLLTERVHSRRTAPNPLLARLVTER